MSTRFKSLPPLPIAPPGRTTLEQVGLGWMLQIGPLSGLSSFEQEQVLQAARWVDLERGALLLRRGQLADGVYLVVMGRVAVRTGAERKAVSSQSVWRRGPGTLLGERSTLKGVPAGSDVHALTSLRTLYLPQADFLRLCREVPALGDYARSLMDVRERMSELLQALAENRLLHSLGRQASELLLLSARLHRGPSVNGRGDAVYVVLQGTALLLDERGDNYGALHGPGSVIGLHEALHGPSPRHGRVLKLPDDGDGEVIEIPGSAMRALLQREPRLLRHLQLAVESSPSGGAPVPRGRVVALSRATSGLLDGALGYGLAAAMSDPGEAPAVLIDLNGQEMAHRLGWPVRDAMVRDVAVREVTAATDGCRPVRVLWPKDRSESAALVRALTHSAELLVIMDRAELLGDTIGHADTVVGIGQDAEDACEIPDELGQLRVSLFPVPGGAAADIGGLRHFVRLPADPHTAERFFRERRLAVLADPATPLGRACRRLGRVVLRRSVGLALGGGGAWGFAQIALLECLAEAGVPVDYIAGSSFGALVGGLYAAGGLPAVRELRRRCRPLLGRVAAASFSADAIARFVDDLCGGVTLAETEIPFFPVATDLETGREAIIGEGTVGAGVRASGALPPAFTPVRQGRAVLIDGGFSNNVPASVVWNAGADFAIAANIIPRRSERMNGGGLPALGPLAVLRRFHHMIQGLLLLMWQNGIDRSRSADYTFDLGQPAFTFYDFLRADDIMAAARPLIEGQIPALRRAYRAACGPERARHERSLPPAERRMIAPLH